MAARMIRVKVIPRSAKSEIAGQMADGTLKVKLAAVPEKGRANEALIVVLADHFGHAAKRRDHRQRARGATEARPD